MCLQAEIEISINYKKFTVWVFLDFKKALNMLWIDEFIHKIINLNICGNMVRWIRNLLTDRTIQVKVGDALSETSMQKLYIKLSSNLLKSLCRNNMM